jgi:hypothetical protein
MSYSIEENQKSPFIHIRFGRSKSLIEGLGKLKFYNKKINYQFWPKTPTKKNCSVTNLSIFA